VDDDGLIVANTHIAYPCRTFHYTVESRNLEVGILDDSPSPLNMGEPQTFLVETTQIYKVIALAFVAIALKVINYNVSR